MNVIVRERDSSCYNTISADDLKIGQMGIITEGDYMGNVVLRTYIGLVSLTHPRTCWLGDFNHDKPYDQAEKLPNIQVRVINSNQEVVLQSEK